MCDVRHELQQTLVMHQNVMNRHSRNDAADHTDLHLPGSREEEAPSPQRGESVVAASCKACGGADTRAE